MADGYENLSLIFDYDLFGDDFNIVIEPKSEVVDEPTADTLNIQKNATINIPVEPGKSIVFDQIFYDYNSTTIKSGAAQELDALASAMLSKSDMKIRLESHTDSRGASAYNLQLSISRAEAARSYLINLGVASDRIKIRGWGETRLRNRCTDKVPCKETDHAFNRRTEVFVEY
ncbi:MAG: OmpA family protein [Saprospiraceae bacterium]|nr:OmpA family protein [Saprospiraceae bacterium]